MRVKCESQLVINQLNGNYEAKEENMIRYLERVKNILGKFDSIEFVQISREDNHVADLLSRLATSQVSSPLGFVKERCISKVYSPMAVLCANNGSSWMTPIVRYLEKD